MLFTVENKACYWMGNSTVTIILSLPVLDSPQGLARPFPQSLGPPDPCVPWTSGPVTLDFLGLTFYWGTTKGEVRLETASGTVELF